METSTCDWKIENYQVTNGRRDYDHQLDRCWSRMNNVNVEVDMENPWPRRPREERGLVVEYQGTGSEEQFFHQVPDFHATGHLTLQRKVRWGFQFGWMQALTLDEGVTTYYNSWHGHKVTYTRVNKALMVPPVSTHCPDNNPGFLNGSTYRYIGADQVGDFRANMTDYPRGRVWRKIDADHELVYFTRRQLFEAWLVALRVATQEYKTLATVSWGYDINVDFTPDDPRLSTNPITPYFFREPEVVHYRDIVIPPRVFKRPVAQDSDCVTADEASDIE